ncbi:uncharacterized protein LOC123655128 [Melitaea cinxia]|uniref:uncharacterized protein LOC123655128 n=1 Tax=Melitaea cinxia TaxID=113334 RepID=UPI001E2718F7|nr:uncharacterized protein LOC123655128 [Melitaea cinxia]
MEEVVKILQNIQDDISKNKQEMKEMELNIKEFINSKIDEKFLIFETKNKELETKIEQQQKTIDILDKQLRRKNVIFFGIEEKEKGYESLLSIVLDIINNQMKIPCQKWEIEHANRIGKNTGKIRPVVVTITTTSRKIEILKKKKSLKDANIYLKEDFPPNVLQKRKELQEDLKRERESGKRVILRYDKIVTLKTRESETRTPTERNKNKRLMSISPEETFKETGTESSNERTKQITKRNKSQTITSFLRLCETRREKETIEEHTDFILFHTPGTKGRNGVGFLIKKYLKNDILNIKSFSDRVALLEIQTSHNSTWSFVQLYAPTEQSTKEDIEYFYKTVQSALDSIHTKNVILLGDFNAKIGKAKQNEGRNIGKYSYGKRSSHGERLVQFAVENDYCFMNSMFPSKPHKKWTWRSPNSQHFNEIDYILTNQSNCIRKFDIIKNLNFNTDHRMIRCELSLTLKSKRRKIKSVDYTRQQLTISADDTSYWGNKFMEAVNSHVQVQNQYDKLEIVLQEFLKQLPRKNKHINKYINDETEVLLKQRKELYTKKRTKEVKSEISRISKKINRNILQQKKAILQSTFEKFIEKTGAVRKAYKELSDKSEWTGKLKNKQGIIQSRRSDIINEATYFYKTLYTATGSTFSFPATKSNEITRTLEEHQPREQAGFRKSYSTMDHIQVVTQVIEKAKEYGKTLYMCFIDYTKAFDSLHFEAIWISLTQQGVNQKYVNLIKNIYTKCLAKVRLEREGTEFPVQKGVRQGDPLSPKLFSAVLESIFRNLDWESKGIKIDGELLNHLRFADDIVVFAESATELESMLNELTIESQKNGYQETGQGKKEDQVKGGEISLTRDVDRYGHGKHGKGIHGKE